MEKIIHTGGKVFFTTLILSIISYLYFTILPLNYITIYIGCIFLVVYFGVNIYIGLTTNMDLIEAILVGTIGCSMGLFLLFFSLYSQLVLKNSDLALWIIKPYFIPTMSLINITSNNNITVIYPIILMIINISLVVVGNVIKKAMNKFKY
ncbi:Uncharacterised protein [uncultured Clostridium sp.]|nr:Uncharacterised protein [uncultured Clostridium sp.]